MRVMNNILEYHCPMSNMIMTGLESLIRIQECGFRSGSAFGTSSSTITNLEDPEFVEQLRELEGIGDYLT